MFVRCRMPAYDNNNWSALFFMVYLIINLYIFMSIVLAVIYNSYKLHLKVCRIILVSRYYQSPPPLAKHFQILIRQQDLPKESLRHTSWESFQAKVALSLARGVLVKCFSHYRMK